MSDALHGALRLDMRQGTTIRWTRTGQLLVPPGSATRRAPHPDHFKAIDATIGLRCAGRRAVISGFEQLWGCRMAPGFVQFRHAALVVLGVLAATLPGWHLAQAQTYPSRTVTLVVPFPAGGSVDGVARILAGELQERTGKSLVVENRAGGAGGTVGSASVASAAPDGYTLLLNASIHVVQPLINPHVRFDVIKDFDHIALIASGPLLVTTHPSVPANTLGEFFALLKADPKRYVIGTTGLGSAGHLTVEYLKQQAQVDTPILTYRGAGPALNDLAGGHIQLLADPMLSSLPNVTAGNFKALAVTSATRSPLAPAVPTIAESGMPAFEMLSWYGLWAPRGLTADVKSVLAREVEAVVTSARFREKLAPLGFEPTFRDAAGLEAYVVDEMAKYGPIVKASNLKVQ